MFLLVAAFWIYTSESTSVAQPILWLSRATPTGDPASCACICPADERAVTDIIWSCLAVIFACTWVAVHPDVPHPSMTAWSAIRHRFWLMVCALIAPEIMVLWAMRQWYGARYLSDALEDRGFTRTHGYFAQMGGFMLWESLPSGVERRIGVLYPNQVWNLILGRPLTFGDHVIKRDDISFKLPSKEDIQDRSKGDGLAKTLVLCQTSWFIAQCVSRWAQGLEITELELVTLAFAALNGVVYFLWWDKPLDVQFGAPVIWNRSEASGHITSIRSSGSIQEVQRIDSIVQLHEADKVEEIIEPKEGDNIPRTDQLVSRPSSALTTPALALTHLPEITATVQRRTWTYFLPASPLVYVPRKIRSLHDAFYNSTPAYSLQTSPLYAYADIHTEFRALIWSSLLAIGFGGIHCAAWSWSFNTIAEKTLWRAAAVTITATPIVVSLRATARWYGERMLKRTSYKEDVADGAKTVQRRLSLESGAPIPQILLWAVVLLAPIYTISRLALLVQALTALRALRPSTRQAVSWVQFLPHV